MKRFTKNIITNFHSLQKFTGLIATKQSKTIYQTNKYKFSNQNISSRQIDIKINEQRWKNLQNNYKALKTSFGLIVPSQIKKDYPKPDRIFFNLQALRECSNQYPQYLFQQLKKPDSKFYQVLDSQMSNLWRAQKKQALQMISFIIHWKIYLKNQQIGEMLYRTVEKMDLSLFDVFQLLKIILDEHKVMKSNSQEKSSTKDDGQKKQKLSIIQRLDPVFRKIFVSLENKIIHRFQVIDSAEYQPLFKIINLFRLYDVYPSIKRKFNSKSKKQNKEKQQPNQQQQQYSFFQIIQRNIIKNLNQIPPSSLAIISVHYANNTKQNQDERIQILQKLQQRIIFNMKFFNHQQLIAILYSYIKASLLTKQFIEQVVNRIRLVYFQMSWQNKKKILAISSSFPKHQKTLILAEAHNELLKGKPVITKLQDGSFKKQFNPKVYIDIDYQLVPEIYLASYQNNLLTQQLAKKMQQIILNNIYNLDRQQIVRSVWLFTITPNINNNLQRLHKKLQVIIQGGFQGGSYSIKDISIIVWSLCNSGTNNQSIYRPDAVFWNNIQFYLQEKLEKIDDAQNNQISKLNQCSSILWAYTFNRALKFKTVSLITETLLEQLQNKKDLIQSFQLINIITFYYSLPPKNFPPTIINRIKQICVQNFQKIYSQMNSIQLMKCLKYLTADQIENGKSKIVIKMKVWENIIQIFTLQQETVQYEHIMGIVGLVINSPLGRSKDKRVVALVNRLLKRKKQLQQIKKIQQMSTKK